MSEEARVADLVEQFLDLKRLGRTPDPESFARRHPDVAPRLLEALEGLAAVEDVARRVRDEPLAGKTIGDYRVAREIGRGGMGVVYEAEDTTLHRRVALKVLPAAALLDPRHLQRFRHEAQAAAQLHHGNIVPVYGVGSSGGLHYYAMQFIDGTDLGTVLRELREGARGREPLSSESLGTRRYLAAVCRLGIQAAEALDHAHQVGVVHRDVKPANLIVDAAGHLWVTDFGLAQFERGSAVTRTGDLVGTFRYMSPEQARGKRLPIDHRTDVYSLGATLYELATLEPVVAGDEPQEVLDAVWNREPLPPRARNPAVPAELETVLLKALAKDPAERYETALALAEDLRRFLDDRPIEARPPTLAHRARKWARRHRGLVGVGVAALAVSTAALAFATLRVAGALEREEAHRARAEDHFRSAMEAVDDLLSEVGDRDFADLPHVEPVRRRLLERALVFQERFLAESAGRAEARFDAARAHLRVAKIRDLLGAEAEALGALDAAMKLLADLPDTLEHRRAFADAYHARAGIHAAHGRPQAAEADHREALSRRARLGGAPRDRNDVATSHLMLGSALAAVGRVPDAEAETRAALAIWRGLVAAEPAEDDYVRGLATGLSHLASRRQDQGDLAGSVETGRQALEQWRRLVDRAPSPTHRQGLAFELGNLAVRLLQDRPVEALPCLEECLAHLERLAREFPSVPAHRLALVGMQSNLGALRARLGDAPGARRANDAAVAAAEDLLGLHPDVPTHRHLVANLRTNRANALHREGRVADAEAELRAALEHRLWLLDRHGDVVEYRMQLARTRRTLASVLARDRWEEAASEYRAIVDLLAHHVHLVDLREVLADTLQAFGAGLVDRRDPGARAILAQAVDHWNALLAAEARPGWRGNLGTALDNLGKIAARAGDDAEAGARFREAQAIFAALVAEDPGQAQFQKNLSVVEQHVAEVHARAGRRAEASDAYLRSLAARRAAASRNPSLRAELGRHLLTVATFVAEEDAARAAGLYDECIAILRPIVEASPGDAESASALGAALSNLAELHGSGGQPEKALDLLAEAVRHQRAALDASPGHAVRREFLGNHLLLITSYRVRLKDHVRGAEAAEEMRRLRPDDVETQRRAGLYLLDCAILARADAGLPDAERLRLAKAYIGSSYAASRRATELAPQDAQMRFDLAWLIVRAPDPALRDVPLALAVAREAVDLEPEDRACRLALGAALARAGQWRDAVAALDADGDLPPEVAPYRRLFLALALAGQGEVAKARTLLDAAGPGSDDSALESLKAEVERALGGPKSR